VPEDSKGTNDQDKDPDEGAVVAVSRPEVTGQVGHLLSWHPVHEEKEQSASAVKEMKKSRAAMWWMWRGSGVRAREWFWSVRCCEPCVLWRVRANHS
jgi:hypothetical protein